jgi:hypothetical protein
MSEAAARAKRGGAFSDQGMIPNGHDFGPVRSKIIIILVSRFRSSLDRLAETMK